MPKANRIKLDPDDHSFLNTKTPYIPENFEHNLSDDEIEVVLDYLNKIRMDYISLVYNGATAKKEEVRRKIEHKKTEKLAKLEHKAQIMLKFAGLKKRKAQAE